MKINRIETPIEFIIDLDWDKEDLETAKKHMVSWDKRDEIFYRNMSKDSVKFDKSEREHFRNSIKYWEKKLKNENK